MTWLITQRRWRRAAEAALAPVWHLSERDRLASELARRIWLAHGGKSTANGYLAELRSEGILLLLEAMVTRHLDEQVIRASLGLRYLEALAENVCRADYEDARVLMDEARWVEQYLRRELHCPLLSGTEAVLVEGVPEHATCRKERLYRAVMALAEAELREAGVAA